MDYYIRSIPILRKNGSGVKKLRNKNKGFTLIELLVVIAIIGLLASVVLLSLNSARAKSRDAKRLSDVRQLVSAMEMYFNDKSAYPTNTASVTNPVDLTSQGPSAALAPKYIGQIPAVPSPADGPCAGKNVYNYQAPADGSSYTLTFCLGDVTGGYQSNTHTASPTGIQ